MRICLKYYSILSGGHEKCIQNAPKKSRFAVCSACSKFVNSTNPVTTLNCKIYAFTLRLHCSVSYALGCAAIMKPKTTKKCIMRNLHMFVYMQLVNMNVVGSWLLKHCHIAHIEFVLITHLHMKTNL